jgi:hypothetical protein
MPSDGRQGGQEKLGHHVQQIRTLRVELGQHPAFHSNNGTGRHCAIRPAGEGALLQLTTQTEEGDLVRFGSYAEVAHPPLESVFSPNADTDLLGQRRSSSIEPPAGCAFETISRASNRHRRPSALFKRLRSRNGGRSSGRRTLKASDQLIRAARRSNPKHPSAIDPGHIQA